MPRLSPENPAPKVQLLARVDPATLAALREYCVREGVSMRSVIETAVLTWLRFAELKRKQEEGEGDG